MRTLSSAVMAVLIVAALFWGNCYSCPQALLSLQAHRCCHPTKASHPDCQSQLLQHFVKAHAAEQAVPAVARQEMPAMPLMVLTADPAVPATIDSSPPEPFSLRI